MSTDRADRYTIRDDERRPSKRSAREALIETIAQGFRPLYRTAFGNGDSTVDHPFERAMQQHLAEANIKQTVEDYLSIAVATGLVVGVLLGLVSGVVGYLIVLSPAFTIGLFARPSPLAIASGVTVSLLLGGVLGVAAGFGAAYYYPQYRARKRRQAINKHLTDAVLYAYGLSHGGVGPINIFRNIATSPEDFGEVATEFQRVTREVDFFDADGQGALEEVAAETPNPLLRDWMLGMASVLTVGGDLTDYLEKEKEQRLREMRRTQDETLEQLDVVNTMYPVLMLGPTLLITVFSAMAFQSIDVIPFIAGTAYLLIPVLAILFLLLVSTITPDEYAGSAQIDPPSIEAVAQSAGVFDTPLIDRSMADATSPGRFEAMRRQVLRNQLYEAVTDPWSTFVETPVYAAVLSGPLAVLVEVALLATGVATPTVKGVTQAPLRQTVLLFYVPVVLALGPYALFYELGALRRRGVISNLTETLHKLANANAAEQTMLESIREVGERGESQLARELTTVHKRVYFWSDLRSQLVAMNNRYLEPRIAQAVKLINQAQQASSDIVSVLETAAILSEEEDELKKERKSRSRVQIYIVGMSFVILLLIVVVMRVTFLDQLTTTVNQAAQGQQSGAFSTINGPLIETLYLHSVVGQGFLAGLVAGKIKTRRLSAGLKYSFLMLLLTAVVWEISTVV